MIQCIFKFTSLPLSDTCIPDSGRTADMMTSIKIAKITSTIQALKGLKNAMIIRSLYEIDWNKGGSDHSFCKSCSEMFLRMKSARTITVPLAFIRDSCCVFCLFFLRTCIPERLHSWHLQQVFLQDRSDVPPVTGCICSTFPCIWKKCMLLVSTSCALWMFKIKS